MGKLNLAAYSSHGFDRGAPRWKEVLWRICSCLFFQTPVPWPSGWKVALLRGFGAKIGERVRIREEVSISFPWRLELGDDVWIGEGVLIVSLAPVRVASNVCLSQRVFLCAGSHNHRKETFDLITAPITIGDSCWVAAQAFIGPGVNLGEQTIVSGGSVVIRSVPPGSFVCGNPALVRPRTG